MGKKWRKVEKLGNNWKKEKIGKIVVKKSVEKWEKVGKSGEK